MKSLVKIFILVAGLISLGNVALAGSYQCKGSVPLIKPVKVDTIGTSLRIINTYGNTIQDAKDAFMKKYPSAVPSSIICTGSEDAPDLTVDPWNP